MPRKNKVLWIIVMACIIVGCATSPPTTKTERYGPGTIIAVWNIEDLSPVKSTQVELGEFITATIIETLENRCGFTIVEREKLLLALEELSLGSSDLASESTLLQLGKILGAKLMVFGAYQDIGGTTRFDLRLVEVESGRVINVASNEIAANNLDARLKGAEKAVRELCLTP